MKVIDQTPFFKDKGELSILDRAKATMQFGAGWFKEIDGQKEVISVFEKVFDRNYTLLRNVTPPGMDARIPFILIGPTGVYVMYVTSIAGMFRAKGDQWGTVSGSTFKAENPNLLTRTERMARAIQVFLQRQGYVDLPPVEAVLLCASPSITVDSLRPLIRVVMRDAVERFAVSVTQMRVVLSPESVHDVVNRILNPPAPAAEKPAAPAAAAPAPAELNEDIYVPDFALPGAEPVSDALPAATPFLDDSSALDLDTLPAEGMPRPAVVRRKSGMSRKQWVWIIIMLVFWCLLATGLAAAIYYFQFR
jgi:hypothetical protein